MIRKFENKLNKEKITGASTVLSVSSVKNSVENIWYVIIPSGKKKEIIWIKIALSIVAIKPNNAGIKKPFTFKVLWKRPVKKPIIVLKRQFNPIGAALKKSKNNPEKKPVISPVKLPL